MDSMQIPIIWVAHNAHMVVLLALELLTIVVTAHHFIGFMAINVF